MTKGSGKPYGKWQGKQQKQQKQDVRSHVPERDVINPYTFIPMSKKEPERKTPSYGELSGYIDCTMDIISPVFIPNTTKDFADEKIAEHKHRVFYSYDDLSQEAELTDEIRMPRVPVIPGSEIRGMLRNVYEQLTNSCFVHIDESNLPFKRSAEPKELCLLVWDAAAEGWRIYADVEKNIYKGAIIHQNGKMTLEKSFKGRYDIDPQYRESYKVFDTAESLSVAFDVNGKTLRKDPQGGWYVHIPAKMKSGRGGTTTANRQLVYTDRGLLPENGVLLSEAVMERFEYVLGVCEGIKGGYRDEALNKSGDSKTRTAIYAKRYKQKKPLVVYADRYSVKENFSNEIIYLSPASLTKEFFGETIFSILEKNAKHQKCQSREAACPACRLFGMIGEKSSLRGKIRCTDGEAGAFTYGEEITLPILATPKIAATEFYLRKPDAMKEGGIWNYDYYTTYRRNGRTMEFIRHPYTAELSGRKVYWTHTPTFKPAQKEKMNSSVTPMNAGRFSFRVYFDRLTKEELEQLLFCIELSVKENEGSKSNNSFAARMAAEKKGCHKIGGAKPLGWGAVKLTADAVTCVSYQMQNGKIERAFHAYVRDDALRAAIEGTKEACRIMRYALSENMDASMVRYPARPDNKTGERFVYLWFSKNRGSIAAPEIQQMLPHIDEENQNLKE